VKSPIFDRRRSDRLGELLDEAAGRRRHHRRTELDAELAELVRLTGHVAALRTATDPDPEFRTGLRSMLIAKIDREGIGVTAEAKATQKKSQAALAGKTQVVRQVPAGHARTRVAVLIGVTAGALALSGVSAASTDSLPGEPLYQVKRSSERAQLALAGSDITRGKLHLEFASSRLREAQEVTPDQAPAVLADMIRETERGRDLIVAWAMENHDGDAIKAIEVFAENQLKLISKAPNSAAAAESRSFFRDVYEQAVRKRQAIH